MKNNISILLKNQIFIIMSLIVISLLIVIFDFFSFAGILYFSVKHYFIFSAILIVLNLFLKSVSFQFLYLFLRQSSNKNISSFANRWRIDNNVKLKVLIFTFLYLLCPLIVLNFGCVNIFIALNNAFLTVLSSCVFIIPVVILVFSLFLLYFVWFLFDLFKNKKYKNEQSKKENLIQVSDDDRISNLKSIKTSSMIFLCSLTNNVYLLNKIFKFKKYLNSINLKEEVLSNKSIMNIFFVCILSIIICVLSSFNMYRINCFILYVLYLILSIIFSYYTYLFVNKSLKIIENYALEKYNIDLRYDRIYAFLFGIFYLNYAINTYKDRLTGNYNFKKMLLTTKSNYILLLVSLFFVCLIIYLYVLSLHSSGSPM